MAENSTPNFALPYPSGTGGVKLGATNIGELAKRLDEIMAGAAKPSIIATEQSRENIAYGTLATPDEVTVVLPENGLIAVAYQATWKQSVSKAGRAAIFLGTNQLRSGGAGSSEAFLQEAQAGTSKQFSVLASAGIGLVGTEQESETEYGGDVTTGQIVGGGRISTSPLEANHNVLDGGPCYIFAAAGTYTIGVQFKSASGKVTVKNRKLWAWVVA